MPPLVVGPVPTEHRLHLGPVTLPHRLQGGDGLAPSNDREALPAMLDGVEKVREAPRRFGRAYLGHRDQIIRSDYQIKWACGESAATIEASGRCRPAGVTCVAGLPSRRSLQ